MGIEKISNTVIDSGKQKETYESPSIVTTANLKDITLGGGGSGGGSGSGKCDYGNKNLSWK